MAAKEIIEGTLATLAAESSLFFEVKVTRQVHNDLISIIKLQVQNKL